jgi:preprotein translocase subunit SecG
MTILFLILVIIVAAVIALFILVQNPKGGGLAGTIGGFNSQFMGVKQTTDVLEKGTWPVVPVLCILYSAGHYRQYCTDQCQTRYHAICSGAQ